MAVGKLLPEGRYLPARRRLFLWLWHERTKEAPACGEVGLAGTMGTWLSVDPENDVFGVCAHQVTFRLWFAVATVLTDGTLSVTVPWCPAVRHLQNTGRGISHWYPMTTSIIMETLAQECGFTFVMSEYDEQTGKTSYSFKKGGLLDDFVFYSISENNGGTWSEMNTVDCAWGPHVEASAPLYVLQDGTWITPITGFPDWDGKMHNRLCGRALCSRDTDRPGIYAYVVDFSEKTWNIEDSLLIWEPATPMQKDTKMAEIFSFLKFAQPSAIKLRSGDLLMSHWFAENGRYKTVATRIVL